nr:MAG TPA: hypothetical protein [Caudoviricetes sp.]
MKEKVFFLERAGLSQHQRLVGSSIWGSPRIHCFSTKSDLSKKITKKIFVLLSAKNIVKTSVFVKFYNKLFLSLNG